MQELWKDLLARKSSNTESPEDRAAVGYVKTINPIKEEIDVAESEKTPAPRGTGKMAHNIQDLTIESTLGKIKHKLMIMSGKGGVGKSSIAANIAVALSNKGMKTGNEL